jgi:hypothetical protein
MIFGRALLSASARMNRVRVQEAKKSARRAFFDDDASDRLAVRSDAWKMHIGHEGKGL